LYHKSEEEDVEKCQGEGEKRVHEEDKGGRNPLHEVLYVIVITAPTNNPKF